MLSFGEMAETQPRQGKFRVTVYYREPTYELVAGRKAEPYQWVFAIDANTADEARTEAIRQFYETARLSSVGWVRKIENIEVSAEVSLAEDLSA